MSYAPTITLTIEEAKKVRDALRIMRRSINRIRIQKRNEMKLLPFIKTFLTNEPQTIEVIQDRAKMIGVAYRRSHCWMRVGVEYNLIKVTESKPGRMGNKATYTIAENIDTFQPESWMT